jgi:hypothetical protein
MEKLSETTLAELVAFAGGPAASSPRVPASVLTSTAPSAARAPAAAPAS